MIRAAPWEGLGTGLQLADRRAAGAVLRACPQGSAAQAAALTPRPPFNARVETVTTKPFFREPFTPNGGLVVQSGTRSLRHRDAIISLAAFYKLPAVYSARDYASASGLLSKRRRRQMLRLAS
jgi:hypothetical protein